MLLGLHLLEELALDVLLAVLLGLALMLVGGVLTLVLALARVVLVGVVLVTGVLARVILALLGTVGDVVVRIATSKSTFLWATTTPAVQVVVVKPRELADDKRQVIIPKAL